MNDFPAGDDGLHDRPVAMVVIGVSRWTAQIRHA
ncbi:phosphotransferase system HPr-like phosphotransfer protein [Sphingomonas sp. UYAg733]